MATRVRDRDHGARRVQRQLERLEDGVRITVGVHEGEGAQPHPDSGGATVADIATFLELGTLRHAPQSWLRAALDERMTSLRNALAEAGLASVKTASMEAFEVLGEELAAVMRARVSSESGAVRDAIQARVGEPH